MRCNCALRCASVLAAASCLLLLATAAQAEEWLRAKSPLRVARGFQPGAADVDDAFADDAPPAAAAPRRAIPDPETQRAEDLDSMTLRDSLAVSDEGQSYRDGLPSSNARSGRFFGGAEYLFVRASFSQAPAYLQIDGFGGNTTETLVPHDFEYNSSVRAFAGWYWAECGVDLMFTYTNLSSTADQFSPFTPGTFDPFFVGHQEVSTTPGERIHGIADVNVNAYDLGISKTLCLGGCEPSCAPCQDDCDSCNTCAPCRPCAPWDLTWSLSIRLADASWNNASEVVNAAGVIREIGSTAMSFEGAGPRVGLGARRYMGACRQWSLFASGHMSLLLGDYEIIGIQDQPGDLDIRRMNTTHVIPVTEIEVGGSWQISRSATLSGGYLFQAWHDLGMSDEFGGNLPPFDDANILGFDGFFVRGELSF